MNRNKSYTGIDYFRLIAAFLIIAIHTSPLASFGETGDFVLTRIAARVCVPFFFMTSGFFLISRYSRNAKKLKSFLKKTALIYGAAILIYIPMNLYNDYFSMDNLLPNMIKDIVFDGTLYHLWYLPASMLGAVIAWYLVKKSGYGKAFTVAVILYVIGLFGDSYYGMVERSLGWKGFYELVFQISDYTRNGVFFAPVFFILGGYIAQGGHSFSLGKSIFGFVISFALMFLEAITLHHFNLQRHDSMYVFLLPCMYFLFHILLHFKGQRRAWARTSALIIYIIHPMMIVFIRPIARLLHLQGLLIENSLVHYGTVCLASAVFGIVITVFLIKYKSKGAEYVQGADRAYLELNLDNLAHNVRVLKAAMPKNCELMAVVKTEAYGHGAFEISTYLDKMGVKAFAVATLDEGIRLRKYGVCGEILILGYTDIRRAYELKKYDLMQTVTDFAYACALNGQRVSVKTHIKIDTGMHRLGMKDDNFLEVKKVFSMKYVKVCGIYTHLCCADSLDPEDVAFTRTQIDRFYRLTDKLKKNGVRIPNVHIQSSYGLLNYPDLTCDYVRAGIALYGVLSRSDTDTVQKLDLRPVLSLKTKVVLIRSVRQGEGIGYGRSFITKRDSRIAILPVGYGDGFPRELSCKSNYVRIRQYMVPVIGRICMDQLAVDLTDAEDIAVGDVATLIGGEGAEQLMAPVIAERCGSISNELLCRMGARLPVIVRG